MAPPPQSEAAGDGARPAGPPRERLDLDPERPSFLLLETSTGRPEQPKKPRIGPVETSGALASARAFLASAAGRGPVAGVPLGSCDPEIARARPAEVRLPGQAVEAEPGADGEERHVQMDVGLGVFDVGGSVEALLQRGVPSAAGHLPDSDSSSEDEDAAGAPLIQEVPSADNPAESP
mmetsp:Transcript_88239/g.263099  ORF Transcript_88239/g.263099 Transcript_88239/m.263099 type:complete len:178 (-) Transcript_88239:136-669(-)